MTTTTRGKELDFSSSSSSSASRRSSSSYHVFLSFRGEDTRWNFVDHLYTALTNAGFRTFRDDDEIQRGESIKVELRRAIEESRVSIVVFSRNYASSSWCLDELAMIHGRRRRGDSGHVVLPVFYWVDPSDVRNQKGVYAMAFATHEKRFRFKFGVGKAAKEWKETLKGWRDALEEVAGLAGMPLPDGGDRHESRFIRKIVKAVGDMIRQPRVLNVATYPVGLGSRAKSINLSLQDEGVEDKLRRPRVLNVAAYPVGLGSRAKSINLWLQDGGVDAGIISICGIGGIGKTTIAKFVYNSNFSKFEGSSFLENIGEISGLQNGLIGLQRQLLSDILSRREEKICNVGEGIVNIKEAIGSKRVLIVLDDVDKWEQLDAGLGIKEWLSPGSKLIITTRHEQFLTAHKCWKVYRVKELDHDESLQLFSWHAFGQSCPIDGYLVASKRVVDYCKGIPFDIELLGSGLSGKSLDMWKGSLEKLMAIPEHEIFETLKRSYDSLQDRHDQDLFLDIACFFIGEDKDISITILDACGYFAWVGIQNLIDRNMLTIDGANKLVMHQLIQKMGREIVRQESPKELGARSRLWDHRDSFHVLTAKIGTRKIRGLALNMHLFKEDEYERNSFGPFNIFSGFPMGIATENSNVALDGDAFSWMSNLQLLRISHVQLFGNYKNFPKGLRWLHWSHCPLQRIPKDFPLDKLVALEMPHSCLKKVFNGTKCLLSLKILNLSHSHYLIETPNFSGFGNLERLILKNCSKLVKVDKSIVCLERLVYLNLSNCESLRKLPQTIYRLRSLATLDISGCLNLEDLSAVLGNMNSLSRDKEPMAVDNRPGMGSNDCVFEGQDSMALKVNNPLFGSRVQLDDSLVHRRPDSLVEVDMQSRSESIIGIEDVGKVQKVLAAKSIEIEEDNRQSEFCEQNQATRVSGGYSRVNQHITRLTSGQDRRVSQANQSECIVHKGNVVDNQKKIMQIGRQNAETVRQGEITGGNEEWPRSPVIRPTNYMAGDTGGYVEVSSDAALTTDSAMVSEVGRLVVGASPPRDLPVTGLLRVDKLPVEDPVGASEYSDYALSAGGIRQSRESRDFDWDELASVEQSRPLVVLSSSDLVRVDPSHPAHEGRDGGVELTMLSRPINVFSGSSQFPMDYEHSGMGLHGVRDGFLVPGSSCSPLTGGPIDFGRIGPKSIRPPGGLSDGLVGCMGNKSNGGKEGAGPQWLPRDPTGFATSKLQAASDRSRLGNNWPSPISHGLQYGIYEPQGMENRITDFDLNIRVASGRADGSGRAGDRNLNPMDPLVGKGSELASWAKLLESSGPRIPRKLEYNPPLGMMDGIPIVKLPEAIIEENTSYWQSTLVGYFVEKSLPFLEVRSHAMRRWKRHGLLEVISNNRGFYLFRFDTIENMVGVFDAGPWYFENRPILLKCWEPGMNLSLESHTSVPLWVKIYDVPLEGWSPKGIAVIAGGLGRPIRIDPMTEDRCRMGFARVCVEMNVSSSFPKYILYDQGIDEVTGDPKAVWLPVEYMWVPSACSHCRVFGHKVENCSKVPHSAPDVSRPSSVVPPKGKGIVGDEEWGT